MKVLVGELFMPFYLKKVTRVKHRFVLFDEIFNKKIEIDKMGRRA